MKVRLLTTLLVLTLLPASLIACDNGPSKGSNEGTDRGGGEPAASGIKAPDAGGEDATADAPAGDDATAEASDGELGVGMISSGQAAPVIQVPTPAAPEVAGRSRRVNEAELPGLVRFTLFTPTFLPDDSYTVAPIITEPEAGGPGEGLPSVATGYTVADRNSFAFVLSPAGEGPMPVGDGDAEEITVGGVPATLYENAQGKLTIVWEREDTRLEIRSAGLARDVVLQIAEGLQPIE